MLFIQRQSEHVGLCLSVNTSQQMQCFATFTAGCITDNVGDNETSDQSYNLSLADVLTL